MAADHVDREAWQLEFNIEEMDIVIAIQEFGVGLRENSGQQPMSRRGPRRRDGGIGHRIGYRKRRKPRPGVGSDDIKRHGLGGQVAAAVADRVRAQTQSVSPSGKKKRINRNRK